MENGTLFHYLNGVQCEEPGGWADFTEGLERNFDQRIIATQYPIEVTFTGGAYSTLRELFLENFCTSVEYTVDYVCGPTYRVVRGIISLADVDPWNLNKCSATVKVQDDGYGARIFNNKDIKVYPTATLTKNSEALTPVTHIDLEVFNPSAAEGVYLADTRRAYDWMDCMEHTVQYITDGEVTAESQWYQDLPEDEKYALVYGRELRVADGASLAPQFSFEELFANAWKKYNLWAYITRDTSGNIVLRIEEEGDTYTSTLSVAMPDQDDLEQSIESDLLYERVEVGSETYIKDEDVEFSLPFLTLQGFVKEDIHFSGTCNTDSAFDLVSTFVIDTNVIEDSVIANNDEYDEDIFMIQYSPYQARATKGSYLIGGTNPFLYNEQLLNIKVLERFDLPGDLIIQSGPDDPAFQATDHQVQGFWDTGSVTSDVPVSSPNFDTRFQDDFTAPNFDTDNTWGNGTPPGTLVSAANSRYTAEVGATGLYAFIYYVPWRSVRQIEAYGSGYFDTARFFLRAERYNAANVLISSLLVEDELGTLSFSGGNYAPDQTSSLSGQFVFYLQAGDYVKVIHSYYYLASAFSASAQFTVLENAEFRTDFVAIGGGSIDVDPDDYRATVYRFDRSCTASDWVNLRDTPIDMVSVATDASSFRNAHVLKASRHIATGETEWELIANRQQEFK